MKAQYLRIFSQKMYKGMKKNLVCSKQKVYFLKHILVKFTIFVYSNGMIMDFSMCSYFCMKMEDCNAFRITEENICITYDLTDTNIASCLKISNDFVELWMKKSQLVETTCTRPWGKSKEKKTLYPIHQ